MHLFRLPCLAASLSILHVVAACGQPSVVDTSWGDLPFPSDGQRVDEVMADAGAAVFRANCSACHYLGGNDPTAGLGPNLAGVTARRDVEWIAGMISNPDSMIATDSIAERLYDDYGIPMLDVQASPAEVRALLEFLRRADRGS